MNENLEKFSTIVLNPNKMQEMTKEGLTNVMILLEKECNRLVRDMNEGIQSTLKISNKVYRRRRNQD